MTDPYINLYKAIIDNCITASLMRPVGELPDYECEPDKVREWQNTRDSRRRMREREEDRLEAQDDLMTEYMAMLYWVVYKQDIKPVRELIQIAWEEIEKNPNLSAKYKDVFCPLGTRKEIGDV